MTNPAFSSRDSGLFQAMFEQVPFPLMVVDVMGRVAFANQGCAALLGHTQREFSRMSLQDLCVPYERDRYLFRTLAHTRETTELDLDLRQKGGRTLLCSVSFSPFVHGGVPRLLVAFRDVTSKRVEEGQVREREERYRKLLDERDALEAQLIRSSKLACLGEIASGIAHEINNPLGIILGFSQDLLDELAPDHPMHESVKIIEKETSRCSEVVKSLLDYARLRPPQVSEVNLCELLEGCLSLLKPKVKKNKIRVRMAFSEHIPSILVDPHLIQQALLNVMINAVQAMAHGGDLRVAVGHAYDAQAGKDKGRVCITVSDTGHGIQAEHLGRIFDPFFSTKGSKGTGLGLSVSQRVIEDHFGRIEVESSEKEGTTCRVFLPLR